MHVAASVQHRFVEIGAGVDEIVPPLVDLDEGVVDDIVCNVVRSQQQHSAAHLRVDLGGIETLERVFALLVDQVHRPRSHTYTTRTEATSIQKPAGAIGAPDASASRHRSIPSSALGRSGK